MGRYEFVLQANYKQILRSIKGEKTFEKFSFVLYIYIYTLMHTAKRSPSLSLALATLSSFSWKFLWPCASYSCYSEEKVLAGFFNVLKNIINTLHRLRCGIIKDFYVFFHPLWSCTFKLLEYVLKVVMFILYVLLIEKYWWLSRLYPSFMSSTPSI